MYKKSHTVNFMFGFICAYSFVSFVLVSFFPFFLSLSLSLSFTDREGELFTTRTVAGELNFILANNINFSQLPDLLARVKSHGGVISVEVIGHVMRGIIIFKYLCKFIISRAYLKKKNGTRTPTLLCVGFVSRCFLHYTIFFF